MSGARVRAWARAIAMEREPETTLPPTGVNPARSSRYSTTLILSKLRSCSGSWAPFVRPGAGVITTAS